MKRMSLRLAMLASLGALSFFATDVEAQYPQPQPYPQQPQPYPQPYPQQPYPQQPVQPYPQQPYPQQPVQPYPQQPYQPYPQQPYQPYPQQPYQPYPQPYPVQPVAPPVSDVRTPAEMGAFYVTGTLYGVGTGIWLDSLAKITNPGPAIVMPLLFGAAAPVSIWAVDRYAGTFHRGVPAATSTGLVLGGLEGMAIAGTQWQYEREDNKDWEFKVQTSVTWIMATAGGVGGFAFGEWLRPDPRSMLFVASGAGWGTISGGLFGIAVQGRHDDWKDGSSIAGLIGFNLGMVGTGAISVFHTPSLQSQKWMWVGFAAGAAAGFLVFPFYLFTDDANLKGGFIGPALGGALGAGVAGALTWNMKDAGDVASNWKPPVDLAMAPIPPLTPTATNSTSQSSRALSNVLGPDPRWSSAPPGAMFSATGSF